MLSSLFSSILSLFWAICPFPIIKYIHTYNIPIYRMMREGDLKQYLPILPKIRHAFLAIVLGNMPLHEQFIISSTQFGGRMKTNGVNLLPFRKFFHFTKYNRLALYEAPTTPNFERFIQSQESIPLTRPKI